jgi:ubiquinone/menaquinone biosynthesis C-methylase UbiE
MEIREDKRFYKSLGIDWREAKERGSLFDRLFQRSRFNAIKRSFDFRDKVVLDIGCNTGVFTFEIANLGARIFGIDISLKAIRRAREYSARLNCDVPFFVADMDFLPFQDNRFDIVIITATLDHIKDPTTAIGEIRRVLKPGGKVFVDVTYRYSLVNLKIIRKIFSSQKNDEKRDYWEAGYYYSYTPGQLSSLFSDFRQERLWIGTYLQELYGIFEKV